MANKEHEYDQFIEKYKPIKNHLDDNAGFDGYMYETYGPEIKYIEELVGQEQAGRMWTVIDNNNGWLGVVAGVRRVNRLGYMVTELPWEDINEEYTISDESEVNEWFNKCTVGVMSKIFPDHMFALLEYGDRETLEELPEGVQDVMLSEWHEMSINEREEIMNRYKQLEDGKE